MLIIIDNYDSFTHNIYQAIADKIDTRIFRNDKISIKEIIQFNPSGIILSPGPGRPEDAGICIELIKQLAPHIPILGICLGHQAIATAFNGKVIQHQEMVHGKARMVHHLQDELFANVPTTFRAARYHSLIVELATMPADLKVLAIDEHSTVMALKHANYPCYGVQFHPESVLTEAGQYLLENFVGLCQTKPVMIDHATTHPQQAYAA